MKFGKLKKLFENATKPKINGILLFGAPGAGKGTYGNLIKQDWNLQKLSPGDIIRKLMTKKSIEKSEKYETLKHCMDNGLLVSDEIVLDLIEEEYNKNKKNHKGVIFDGIPRNISQAEILHKRFDLKKYLIINIILKEDILIEKLQGRRICVNCGQNYNICEIDRNGYFMKPLMSKEKGLCDGCGGKLEKRRDDRLEVIEKRLEFYKRETEPLLEGLREKGVGCVEFEPKKGVEDYPRLKRVLEGYEFC